MDNSRRWAEMSSDENMSNVKQDSRGIKRRGGGELRIQKYFYIIFSDIPCRGNQIVGESSIRHIIKRSK